MKNNTKLIYKIIILIALIIFTNANFVMATDSTVIDSKNWEEWQKNEYWEWHTRTTTDDKAYNGNHIVIQNDVIDFYGYWQTSYKDFLYKEYKNPGKKIFKFRIDESKANYHTLDGAGFIFNASKIENKLSGYILVFKEKTVNIYLLEDVNIDKFETTASTTIDTYGKCIATVNKVDTTIHDLTVEATPTYIKVTENNNEILNEKLDYSNHKGESFGLISSYLQHACSILSKIEFSQLKISIEDYDIKIKNTDLENNALQGGYFELKNEKGEVVKEGNTDNNGIFTISGILPGVYTVQQTKEPNGYILNDTVYTFKVTEEGKIIDTKTNKEIEVVVKNKKIEKEDIENRNETNEIENIIKNEISSINNVKDNTISNRRIPNAGERSAFVKMIILVGTIVGITIAIWLKKYKQVK